MMKELYISPEMEILCFAPMELVANGFDNSIQVFENFSRVGTAGNGGVSTSGNVKDDVGVTLPNTDIDPLD